VEGGGHSSLAEGEAQTQESPGHLGEADKRLLLRVRSSVRMKGRTRGKRKRRGGTLFRHILCAWPSCGLVGAAQPAGAWGSLAFPFTWISSSLSHIRPLHLPSFRRYSREAYTPYSPPPQLHFW
jgi:hypothetical protein